MRTASCGSTRTISMGTEARLPIPSVTSPHTPSTALAGNGNVISQIDGLNNPTTYTYDALNRKASMTDADQHTSRYAYDGAGNLLTVLDPMGRTTTCSYDSANQLKTIAYSDVNTS